MAHANGYVPVLGTFRSVANVSRFEKTLPLLADAPSPRVLKLTVQALGNLRALAQPVHIMIMQ